MPLVLSFSCAGSRGHPPADPRPNGWSRGAVGAWAEMLFIIIICPINTGQPALYPSVQTLDHYNNSKKLPQFRIILSWRGVGRPGWSGGPRWEDRRAQARGLLRQRGRAGQRRPPPRRAGWASAVPQPGQQPAAAGRTTTVWATLQLSFTCTVLVLYFWWATDTVKWYQRS